MLRNSTLALFLLVWTVAACGGQIDTGDAGSGPDGTAPTVDGGAPPPSPGACSPMQGGVAASSDGTCSATENWSCGNVSYHIECSCKSNQSTFGDCTCSRYGAGADGGSLLTTGYVNGCPGCAYAGDQLAQRCNFPSN
ncbi:MAG TPA: hypothetical protein VLM85_04150 [Polyangiaceae bacterium]|nr:hypothetical protein [Polyangiaceae bacterium]